MWTKDWPEKTGTYFFYGWCFANHTRPPDYHFVHAKRVGDRMMYVADGHFLYKSEGALGYWCEADLPPPPSLDDPKGEADGTKSD